MKKPILVLIAVILLILIIYLLIPSPPEIETAEVFRDDLQVELTTTGIAESEMADVSPQIVALVSQLLAQENQVVEAGETLAILDRTELVAQLDEAQAVLATARQELSRAEEAVRVYARQAAATVSRAEAGLQAARARLADIERGARAQEIEQARSAVRQARAEAQRTAADLQRAELLFERGAIAAQDLDAARTAAQVAEARFRTAEEQLALVEAGARPDEIAAVRAEVRVAEAALAEARAQEDAVELRRREADAARQQVQRAQAAVDAARARLAYTTITSPFTGVVARRHVERGETVGPQQPIYTLAQLDPVWVIAEVDEDDLAALELGQRAVITSGAYTGRRAEGTVIRISPIAEPRAVGLARTRIVRARIDIEFTEFPLRPGMEVDITGETIVAREAVLVPNQAIVRIGERTQVYVVEANRIYPRDVQTGLSSFDYTEITDGLSPGEIVAITRPPDPEPGEIVRVRGEEDER